MEEQVFLFDMDGSLADHDGALTRDLKLIQAPSENLPEDLWQAENKEYVKARIKLIRNQPGWWFNLEPIEMGMKLYRIAKEMNFVCEVLTKGPKDKSAAWKEKVEWCQKWLHSDIDIHIVSDNVDRGGKARVYGRILYDDYGPYMLKWLKKRPRGLGIMPINRYNEKIDHPNIIKYDGSDSSIKVVIEALRRVQQRKDGEPLNILDLK